MESIVVLLVPMLGHLARPHSNSESPKPSPPSWFVTLWFQGHAPPSHEILSFLSCRCFLPSPLLLFFPLPLAGLPFPVALVRLAFAFLLPGLCLA